MLREPILKAGRNAITLIVMTLIVVAIAAYCYSLNAGVEFGPTMRDFTFYSGAFFIIVGGFLGMGVAENAYAGNLLFALNGKYQKAIVEGRLERRQQQFFMMLFCVAIGVFLLFLPWILR
ncbi:MAG: hypothetical protein HZB92_02410 [Euryarchaeota archaeon]|nr:hypothetical protein [Euryarchaeota archaeon]